MRKVDTTPIVAGAAYPPSKKGLDFIQLSNAEAIAAIAQSIYGDTDNASFYVLFGCEMTGTGPFSFAPGWVYCSKNTGTFVNGGNIVPEIFYFPGATNQSIGVGQVAVLKMQAVADMVANPITGTIPEPTTFTDNTVHTAHTNRTLILAITASGTGDVDFDNLKTVRSPVFNDGLTLLDDPVVISAPDVDNPPMIQKGLDGYVTIIGVVGFFFRTGSGNNVSGIAQINNSAFYPASPRGHFFTCTMYGEATGNRVVAFVQVQSDGKILCVTQSTAGAGYPEFPNDTEVNLNLDGIRFPTF